MPSGSAGQTLVYDGTSWIANDVFKINVASSTISTNNNVANGTRNIVLGFNNSINADWINNSTILGGNSNSIGGTNSFLGGGQGNIVNGSMAIVVGGSNNSASILFATVVGGSNNTASGYSSFIGAGYSNYTASDYSAVVGGYDNNATGQYATVGGGYQNTASGRYSFIGGGYQNTASATSTISLGTSMNVSGNYSFGLNVSTTPAVLNQANTIALMGGNVGIGTTTPNVALAVDGRMQVTQTSTMRDVVPQVTETYSLGSSILKWLVGWFRNLFVNYLFADEATIASSTLANTVIGTSTITNLDAVNATFTSQVVFQATTTHNSGTRSDLYCDINGTNCFDPSLGWVVPISDVTTTPVTSNGDFTSGTMKGYQAANAICNYHYPGYHFCFTSEIISFIRNGNVAKFAGLPQAWIAEGPPGYTAYANDCGGYTTSSATYLGAFWEYNGTTGGGQGWLAGCNNLRAISCCK